MTEKDYNPEIKQYLEALRETPERQESRAAQSRAQFLSRAQELSARTGPSPSRRTSKGIMNQAWLPKLVGLMTAVLLALVSLAGTVYAAQDSLPTDTLYPVKTWTEEIQLRLENNAEDLLDLQASFAERRIQEIQSLHLKGKTVPEAALTRLELQTSQMLQTAQSLPEQNRQKALEQVQHQLKQQAQILQKMQSGNTPQGQQGLNQAQEQIQQQLENISRDIQKTNPGDNKPEDPGSGKTPQQGQPDPPAQGNPPQQGKPDNPGQDQGSSEGHNPPQSPGEEPDQGKKGPPDGSPGKGGPPQEQ